MRKVSVLIVLAAVCALAQNPGTKPAGAEDQIRNMEKQWALAVVKKDPSALDRVLSDKLIYAHSSGIIESKEQYINRLKGGAQRYDTIEHESIRVAVYGDSAVAHSHVRMRGQSDARKFDDYLMMMHIWVKQGGQWKLAAHQTTKLK